MINLIEHLIQNINYYILNNSFLAIIAAFLGGILTASNPCVLAMVPLMIGFIGGYDELKGVKKSFLFSTLFVIGLGITFTIMGLIAAIFGQLLGDVGKYWNYIIFAICLFMSLHLLGIISFDKSGRLAKLTTKVKVKGYIGALILGTIFGIVSTPCAVPILAVILTYIAKGGNTVFGSILLFFYAIGHSILIVIVGTSLGLAQSLISSSKFQFINKILKYIAAVLIFGVGIYFLIN